MSGSTWQPRQLPPNDPGVQCWICPHCHDDAHHTSGPEGCERQAGQAEPRVQIGPLDC